MSRAHFWTCQRVQARKKCAHKNSARRKYCAKCGKERFTSQQYTPPAHMAALDLPYEEYVILNGGEFCGICGSETRKLYRDHAHVGKGIARGLLCWPCNIALRNNEWSPARLRAAADYLERAEQHAPG